MNQEVNSACVGTTDMNQEVNNACVGTTDTNIFTFGKYCNSGDHNNTDSIITTNIC
jgi:hypothetical protein